MKIFIIGSMRHLSNDDDKEKYKQLCREIGNELAVRNHTIILASSSEHTADPYVLEGANQVDGKHRVILVRPDAETAALTQDTVARYSSSNYPNIEFAPTISQEGGWRVVHLGALRTSDGVIAIGGSDRGTGSIIYTAVMMETPVICVRPFGGAAENAWKDFRRDYQSTGMSLEPLDQLDQCKGKAVVDTAIKIITQNPFQRRTLATGIFALLAGTLAVFSWIYLFFNLSSPISPLVTLFLLILLSNLIGSLFGITQKTQAWTIPRRTGFFKDLIDHLTLSIPATFALMLIPSSASYLMTGQYISLNSISDVQRPGALLSAVSFFAALLIDDVLPLIQEAGRKILPTGKK